MNDTHQLPPSLWAATAQPSPPASPLSGSVHADVAIVGAGFCGLRSAIELARAGVSTCVLDSGEIGWGASGRNGGQVNPIGHETPAKVASRWGLTEDHEQVKRYTQFTLGSADALFELVREWQIDCDAEQNGWIRGLHGAAAERDFEQLFEGWQAHGASLRMLDGNELESLSGTRGYLKGWLAPGGGSVQPMSYVRGLARVALESGARIFTRTHATALTREARGWKLTTSNGEVTADTVLLCANGYTDKLFPGLRETIVPVISVQSATPPLTDEQAASILPQRQTFADTRRVIFYFKKTADNRLVFGSAGSDGNHPGDADRQRVIRGLRTVYPQFPELDIEYLWGGQIAVTLDHLPHVHELGPGLITGLGCNGRGVAMATAMGAQLASWVLNRDASGLAIPVTPLKKVPLHRFHRLGVRTAVWWQERQDRKEAAQ